MATGAELTYQTNATALQMAEAIFGNGATVTGASYTGAATSKAIYSNGGLSAGVVPSTSGVILSTGDVRNFTQSSGDPNRSVGTSGDTSGPNNNALFNALAGTNTFDAAWLNVDFIPTGDAMTIRFVFASEEYPEYIGSQFNDVIGVWVNGSSVPISVGTGQTGVNNISATTEPNLFISNATDAYNTEMDGFTLTLSLTMNVLPNVVNSIRIGIADVADAQYDSSLLIAADSLQTVLVARDETVTIFSDQTDHPDRRTFDVLGNDVRQTGTTLTITQINGVNVVAGQTVTLPSGQKVTLNADGTLTLLGDGTDEKVGFTYTVRDSLGNIDTAIVTLNSIPCFVAGTLISTPRGPVPVDRLRPGDLVLTQDDGPQPLRWVGHRRVAAIGAFAPVVIHAGSFGAHETLVVSPQHRIVIRDGQAELLFGDTEVLVAAKDLVNGRSVVVREGGFVDYVHILFDRHQVIFAEGLATESFLPGPQSSDSLDREVLAEILDLFPSLDPATGAGYSPAARRTLRGYEAMVLMDPAA